jgi:O-antigen ligase
MIYILIGYMWLFIHRPFEVWPVLADIRIERVYMGFMLLYWLLFQSDKRLVGNRLQLAFALFWVAFTLSALMSPFGSPTQARTVEDYFKVVVFYVIVITSVHDERGLKRLVLGYLVVVGLYMSHSALEFHRGRHMYRMGIPRMMGIDISYCDPNTFAATLLYSMPLALPFWRECTNRKQRFLLLCYIGLTIYCVLLTGSRSGLVVLVAVLLLNLKALAKHKVVLVALALSVPVIWAALPADLQERFRSIVDSSAGPKNAQQSAEGRAVGFWAGLGLFERSPIYGFGPGAHGMATGDGYQAHNLYGQVLSEMGGLGTLALVATVMAFFANGREAKRLAAQLPLSDPFPTRLCGAISTTIVLLLIKGWGDHNLYRYTWLWFGAFQALAVHCLRERRNREPTAVM